MDVSQWKLAWLTPNLGILWISLSSFWLCESVVANPIIYRLVPRPSRFETRQWSPTDLSSISWVHYSFFQQCYHAKRSGIMLNAILSIAGSSHQSYERFSEISRGRQCSFMTFSALLFAQSFPVRHWDTATVDQISIEGDRMYLTALESQSITDTDTLSLICLPNQARSTVQSPAIEVTE